MRYRFILLFCSLLSCSVSVQADHDVPSIDIISVSTMLGERVYFMNASIETHLPEYIRHAMKNGVPLPLLLQIEVKETKNWWFDKDLVTIEQQYILHYLSLLDSVRIKNLTQGSSRTVGSINGALKIIGTIHNFPLLDKEHFNTEDGVYARIRLKIDVNALPKPLRAQTLLGGDWGLSSAWKEWVIQ